MPSALAKHYIAALWFVRGLPDGTLLPVWRTRKVILKVGPISSDMTAVVTEVSVYYIILGGRN
jgi:hypothetical protein